jgi:hypothetical protein
MLMLIYSKYMDHSSFVIGMLYTTYDLETITTSRPMTKSKNLLCDLAQHLLGGHFNHHVEEFLARLGLEGFSCF